ncbi:MAG: HEAT repeat domain-containing protein [Armatimonadota bacterium]
MTDEEIYAVMQSREFTRLVSVENWYEIKIGLDRIRLMPIDRFSDSIHDIDPKRRSMAVWALGIIRNEDAIESIIPLLSDTDPTVRMVSVQSLGRIGDERTVDHMIRLLDDEVSKVREWTALSLCDFSSINIINPLGCALKDADVGVRNAAAFSLGNYCATLKEVTPITVLQSVLVLLMGAINDEDDDVRATVIDAVGNFKLDADNDPKGQYRAILLNLLNDKCLSVRINAIWAIGNADDITTLEPLVIALNDECIIVRGNAVAALKWSKDPAIQALIIDKCLNDPDPGVRGEAVLSSLAIGGPAAIDAIISALTDQISEVRSYAAMALGEIPDAKVVEALKNALNDDNDEVREEAESSLHKIEASRIEM